MSRTSPGRYALHEFAKNVFEVRISSGAGRELTPERPSLHQWNVTGHDGTVVVSYKVFGDRTDGTYLSVDAAHAHMNMPATVMFVRGQLTRPARVTFVRPPGRAWRVATQLFATDDPLVFTAPNLPYLMDSPTEFSEFTLRSVTIDDGVNGPQTIRAALHSSYRPPPGSLDYSYPASVSTKTRASGAPIRRRRPGRAPDGSSGQDR